MLKNLAKYPIYIICILLGHAVYVVIKKTPKFAHLSMIRLFCLTGGKSNDLINSVIRKIKKVYKFEQIDGICGIESESEKARAIYNLKAHGFYVFEKKLPKDLCDNLLKFAVSHESTMRSMDCQTDYDEKKVIYPRGKPLAVRYDFSTKDLLGNNDVQRVLADISFAAFSQSYLESKPVIDILSMWWHTDFSDKPDSQAAQYYHFDLDRPKWLKFFIYLTDVESTNGPHTYVAGSHKSQGIPAQLLDKGYARLSDEEVERHYDAKDLMEFVAPRGTIIVEDTRGLHKGKHVENGDRLILQVQYSNSLFGALYPKVHMGDNLCADLRDSIGKYPDLYKAYL